jgi:hypothetical protein
VGKQRLALWLAALLQCDEAGAPASGAGEPCGECRSCRLARRLEHPDIHWFFPLPRPKGAGSREKLREKLEEARMEALERRRREPLARVSEEGSTGIYLAAVQEMRDRASRRPAMGPRSIFVVGEAEAMVPQAANPEAANAFLKLLEEPPEDTYVVLTSSRPGALLPTIRSRVLSLPVSPLSDREIIRDFLAEHAGADRDEAERAALDYTERLRPDRVQEALGTTGDDAAEDTGDDVHVIVTAHDESFDGGTEHSQVDGLARGKYISDETGLPALFKYERTGSQWELDEYLEAHPEIRQDVHQRLSRVPEQSPDGLLQRIRDFL